MSNFIIIHDKLLDYGGAEAVLSSLVRFRSPDFIVCSCVSNKQHWEQILGVPILSPKLNFFITNQLLFKFLYPYVILICSLSRIMAPFRDSFVLVYSSSAGKYFRGFDYHKCLVYINYHAKGVEHARRYVSKKYSWVLALPLYCLQFLFHYFEDLALGKFKYIRAISKQALNSLPNYIKLSNKYDLGILHCPSPQPISSLAQPVDLNLPIEYYVVVSRLNPEKSIEPLLDFLWGHTDINIVIIGDGPLLTSFRIKYNNRFQFLGFLDAEVKTFIVSGCLAVIQPTTQEWSLVTVEANTLGVPVISSRSLGLEEINFTISGNSSFPNLLFDSFSSLSDCFSKIKASSSYIFENRQRISSLFSEDVFFKRLGVLIDVFICGGRPSS